MNKIYSLMAFVFFLPNVAIAATDIDAAVQDLCKCGYPPSSRCMDGLAKKYPEIDKSRELQDQVMRGSRQKCGLSSSSDPAGIAGTLAGISKVAPQTEDCSTLSFKVSIPKNWQCRKQNNNAQDVTLYTNGNKLNVTVGKNQGKTSCTVIPICTSEDIELSDKFNTKLYKNPMAGTYEYAGLYKKDGMFKLTITSNSKPTKEQLSQIETILDSFEKR